MSCLGNPGFNLFGIWDVKWYGVIMATSMLVGVIVAYIICKIKKYPMSMPIDIAIAALPLAVVGARLYFVSFYGVESFAAIFRIWDGGMAIYGGVIGGFIGIVICCLIKKYSIWQVCDIAAPCLILGQAIGRWGNFINQEAYGFAVTDPVQQWFPFSVWIDECDKRGCGCSGSGWHLATFFYESLWNLIGFVGLMFMIKFVTIDGVCTSSYLIYYGVGRSWIEGLRMDSLYLWGTGVRVSQALSMILVALGVGLLIYLLVKNKRRNQKQKVVDEG